MAVGRPRAGARALYDDADRRRTLHIDRLFRDRDAPDFRPLTGIIVPVLQRLNQRLGFVRSAAFTITQPPKWSGSLEMRIVSGAED